MNRIALIAVDLDGTLLRSDHRPAPRGAAVLRHAVKRGVRVIIATTRHPARVVEFCTQIGIVEPIICPNGAEIWGSPTGPIWALHPIPLHITQTIVSAATDHGWQLAVTESSDPLSETEAAYHLGVPEGWIFTHQPTRILATDPHAIQHIHDLCQTQFADQCRVHIYYRPDGVTLHSVGVFAQQADKEQALSLVMQRLGISGEQVMAIGDNPNDLPMFRVAAVRVAMGNATDDLKQAATVIAPSNDDDGVAWAVEQFS